jgi:hypothetical protein
MTSDEQHGITTRADAAKLTDSRAVELPRLAAADATTVPKPGEHLAYVGT